MMARKKVIHAVEGNIVAWYDTDKSDQALKHLAAKYRDPYINLDGEITVFDK